MPLFPAFGKLYDPSFIPLSPPAILYEGVIPLNDEDVSFAPTTTFILLPALTALLW